MEEGQGPEDDEAAQERVRRRMEEEEKLRVENQRREATEATVGKEEVKRVLRLMADAPPLDKENPKVG